MKTLCLFHLKKMPAISAHKQWKADESRLLHISTRDGHRSSDGSSYAITIGGNALYNFNISRVFPVMLICPNVFPNVKAPYNTFTVSLTIAATTTAVLTVTPGQYSASSLVAAINGQLGEFASITDLTISQQSSGLFLFTNTSGTETYTVNLTNLNIGRMVGAIASVVVAPASATTLSYLPNLAGERLVHIKSEKLGPSNLLHSRNGRAKVDDVAFTIPLNETPYGGTACYKPGDSQVSDVEFVWDQNISSLDIQLLDDELNPLSLPPNYAVELVLKAHQQD